MRFSAHAPVGLVGALLALATCGAAAAFGLWSERWMEAEAVLELLRVDSSIVLDDAGRDAFWSTYELNGGGSGGWRVTAVGTVFAVLGALAVLAAAGRLRRLALVSALGLSLLAMLLVLSSVAFAEVSPLLTAATVAIVAAITGLSVRGPVQAAASAETQERERAP